MARYFTADLHLGETRLDLMARPFKSDIKNDETILNNINRVVKDIDELIINGDVVSKSALDPLEMLELLSLVNGKKTLIRGNHDEQFTDEQLSIYFDTIIPHGEGIELEIGNDLPVWVTHYPTRARKDIFNLVGHIHSSWKVQLNMINIGVDCNHFRPYSEEQILFFHKAICEFYDDDVWVAYNDSNSNYKDNHKKGSYF